MAKLQESAASQPKDIKDLVTDIYSLFEGHSCDPKRVEEFGRSLAQTIADRLSEQREGREPTLRMSNVGKPDKQLWYEINGSKEAQIARQTAEKLEPHTRLKFLIGDLWESVLLFLAEEAGHTVEHKQATVELDGIIGHIDAIIDGHVTDVKSASTYSFEKFKSGTLKENDQFGYIEQISGYSKSLGDLPGAFLAGDKTLGHLTLLQMPVEELAVVRISDRISHIKSVVSSQEAPERCYTPKEEGSKNPKTGNFSPNGNLTLPTGCSYCKFKFSCWSGANGGIGLRTFLYSGGPRYFVEVKSEPKVLEATF